ncbi:MAG: Holliday junction branch migration protein RuvA [Bacteroidetes bacterium]|uniref:Holliday junction branch migration complex subunit RuvA n=1 Tax=Phaeocystidibacter marisrubri TaxID=1577780 RepID=A0A6L3ZH75_9FLAO|nr:Holliday junction branch migration protein RuvA [Phaeocystidibacter marisrubri]KAB2816928.1 Holliday junction branch migration protein RuvA [Phaeocystidibacter marisrubri]TNE27564.1 MAG: Holliday junction branch migration protein RuvA [Bacteroidota bacterium]GGH77557.1 Holliday junction ATP-dependent DNA helicase RuvA [Phaeocystidibacter marisrubri]
MYHHLRGRLVEKSPTFVVIECAGVGYHVHISLSTYAKLGADENVLLYTHLAVREDAHTLYGFAVKEEREIFRQLIGVSGVGANTARMILSSLQPEEVESAIRSENIGLLKGVKGIGAKTAQRIVVDLKDKVGLHLDSTSMAAVKSSREEAVAALEILGFSRVSVDKVVSAHLKEDANASVESIIKNALQKL